MATVNRSTTIRGIAPINIMTSPNIWEYVLLSQVIKLIIVDAIKTLLLPYSISVVSLISTIQFWIPHSFAVATLLLSTPYVIFRCIRSCARR